MGVNGTNLTITIRATTRVPLETAVVTGTIAGWDALPAPAAGHQTLGLVGASQTRVLGDRANQIPQGTRTVIVPVIGTTSVADNLCVRNALVNDCAWRLTTRTGPQAHFALIVDQDGKGTPNDDSDDTVTLIGWAVKTGLTFTAGQSATGESLALLTDAQLQSFTVAMTSPPSGLDAITAFPMLDLGADGRLPITVPALDLTSTMTRVPALSGDLSAGRYDLLAQAQDAKDKADPGTLNWLHGVDPAATVAVGGWLPPPAGLSAAAGVYSFAPVAGATLQTAELQTGPDTNVWQVSIFDGSSSFTLPTLTPDPLPTGMLQLSVSALRIPSLDLGNVAFDDAREALTGRASARILFTR